MFWVQEQPQWWSLHCKFYHGVLFHTVLTKKKSTTSLKSKSLSLRYELRFIYRYIILSSKSRHTSLGRFHMTEGRAITILRVLGYGQFSSTHCNYVLTTLSKPRNSFLRLADSHHTAKTLFAERLILWANWANGEETDFVVSNNYRSSLSAACVGGG